MIEQHFLDDTLLQLRKLKVMAERAVAQIDEAAFFAVLGPEENSIALIMKHVAGNMRSRWTNFLTTDGEKPDRNRDSEFEIESQDTRDHLMALWEEGWSRVLGALQGLGPLDLQRTVRIRGESHTVLEAIQRQVTHYAAHVGQIVLLSKHYAGPKWATLSIPRGRSHDVDVSKSGSTYGVQKQRS
jgi:Protein of unknown function (DUF1572)